MSNSNTPENDPRLGNIPAVTRQSKSGSAKYRPVLTAAQITHILTLAKTESPMSQMSLSVIASLASFQAKIDNAAITAAYVTSPTVSKTSLEALGGVPATASDSLPNTCHGYNTSPNVSNTYESKESYWAACYEKYSISPASCTLQEIEAAREHKYLNGLMTEEEVKAFERGI